MEYALLARYTSISLRQFRKQIYDEFMTFNKPTTNGKHQDILSPTTGGVIQIKKGLNPFGWSNSIRFSARTKNNINYNYSRVVVYLF